MTQKTVSYPILFISIAGAALVAILLYIGLSSMSPANSDQFTTLEMQGWEAGDDVSLTGVIVSDGDLRFYTHTLTHAEYGLIGLKSRNINLSAHKGNVQLQ